jgi:DNA-binding protein HU-beta
MSNRITKKEFIKRLAERGNTDLKTAEVQLNNVIETLYETFKAGEGVTLTGLGGFYIREGRDSWIFKFSPSQKLRALFGWSSTYKGNL